MRWVIAAVLLGPAFCGANLRGAELKPATAAAFERYIQQAGQRMEGRKSFLWADELPSRASQIRHGAVLVEAAGGHAQTGVPDGIVHDWIGCVYLRGVPLNRTMALMRDYNHQQQSYGPEVADSRILQQHGDHYVVYMRLLKKMMLTVVLDTEHDVQYVPVDATRWRSSSRSIRIAEVEKPGKPGEHELAPGTGQGFLWRLNSYWRFQERDGGTWVECEAISLTRDVPLGLGWLIQPIIQDLPRQSLENTLRETRNALIVGQRESEGARKPALLAGRTEDRPRRKG